MKVDAKSLHFLRGEFERLVQLNLACQCLCQLWIIQLPTTGFRLSGTNLSPLQNCFEQVADARLAGTRAPVVASDPAAPTFECCKVTGLILSAPPAVTAAVTIEPALNDNVRIDVCPPIFVCLHRRLRRREGPQANIRGIRPRGCSMYIG